MNKSQYYSICQDYVCGVVLRVAKEVLTLVPLDAVIITASDEILNSSTGHIELQPIVSAYVARSTLEKLNFSRLDPSDAMVNFNHNMSFYKTQGFRPVPIIEAPACPVAG